MRCLGIDYGERRIGLSFGDDLGVATPLPAIIADDRLDRLEEVASVIRNRRITALVVGYPLNMDGTAGFKAREVDLFIHDLSERTSLPVHRVDERLTTEVARAHLPKGRDDEMRRSGRVDSMAAAIILQDFLDQHLGHDPMVGGHTEP
ncbi:MAG: Holliday junction resolvase RuvX [Verrucomicrobia bacterium]|nr:MAG: Holliday junction resolvase RuvX [Verrucomicrobiota bacterium]